MTTTTNDKRTKAQLIEAIIANGGAHGLLQMDRTQLVAVAAARGI